MQLEIKDVELLLSRFEQSEIAEMQLDAGDTKVVFKRYPSPVATPMGNVPAQPLAAPVYTKEVSPAKTANVTGDALAESEKEPVVSAMDTTEVKAPLAGIFYVAPKPGEEPYVSVGQKVKKGDVLGLIEAMKIINEIEAPCDGTVAEIAAGDGELAEYDQLLFRIEEN